MKKTKTNKRFRQSRFNGRLKNATFKFELCFDVN